MTSLPASAPVRIAIVEDEPAVRRYFMQIIGMAEGHDVIAMAPDLATGRGLITLAPDLFLMDIGLPDGNGYDLVPEIKAACAAKVLIISSFGDRETVVKTLSAGADGYLLKDSSPQQILDGIAITLEGGAPVSPAAAVCLLDLLRARTPSSQAEPVGEADARLTQRETELLRTFAEGKSYKEAARALDISPHTVGTHVKAIYRKLEVNSRSDAIRQGFRS